MAAPTAVEEESYNDTPSILLPCVSCNRTFRPAALAKHSKVCEKSLMKKRKKFDSSKQRIQGTDLAEFLPILPTFTRKVDKSPIRKPQVQVSCANLSSSSKTSLTSPKSKWREKHNELVQTIKAARLPPGQAPPTPMKLSDHEQCPYCERSFGPKAYDRHLEWCKEQQSRVQPRSPNSQRAKERMEARTKYRAPLTNKCKQRSASRDKFTGSRRDPSPLSQKPSQYTPSTPTLTRKKTSATVTESVSTPAVNNNFVKGTPLRSSTRSVSSFTNKRTPQPSRDPEPYDPFKSAERQMLELLGPEKEPPKLAPISLSPPILSQQEPPKLSPPLVSSPTSAFTKFTSLHSPEPLFISEDDNNRPVKDDNKSIHSSEKSDSPLTITSIDNFSSSKDSNQNPISLSTLSLCSTISIESVENNKNSNLRVNLSNSAKVPEKKTPVPIRRTVSAVENRRGRDPFKGKLKMEDMLYGNGISEGERYFGSPTVMGRLERDIDDLNNSNSLFKTLYDAETLNAEQELLKSMTEFEKLLSSPSTSPSPTTPPKLFPSLVSSYPALDLDKHDADFHPSQMYGPDSAYSSLNRKSPVGGEECPATETHAASVAKFCHECGNKYPVLAAKFCCQCGVRRLAF